MLFSLEIAPFEKSILVFRSQDVFFDEDPAEPFGLDVAAECDVAEPLSTYAGDPAESFGLDEDAEGDPAEPLGIDEDWDDLFGDGRDDEVGCHGTRSQHCDDYLRRCDPSAWPHGAPAPSIGRIRRLRVTPTPR